MQIKLKKLKFSNTIATTICYLIIFYQLLGFLVYDLGFPRSLIYLGDIITVWGAINLLYKQKCLGKKYSWCMLMPIIIALIFLGGTIIGLLINKSSFFQYIWGFRNYFRYYIFFTLCISYVKLKDFECMMNIFYKLLIINVPISTYQVFIKGADRDHAGGLYGFVSGSNGYMNIFLIVVCTYYLLRYFKNLCSLKKLTIVLVSCFYLTVLGEIKVFFVEFVIILFISMILSKISMKKIIIIMFSVIIVFIANNYLNKINNYSYLGDKSGFFSYENIKEYLGRDSGYDGVGDLNRFTAIQQLDEKFFQNDTLGKVFGKGLGSADYTQAIEVFKSEFYIQYNYLHYQWFSHAFMFIENGYFGVLIYCLFFIVVLFQGISIRKFSEKSKFYSDFIIIMVVMTIINFIYNISLRVEYSAYLMYLILALPYIIYKEIRKEMRNA